MAEIHASLGGIVLVVAGAFTVFALVVGVTLGWKPWMDVVWKVVVGAAAVQVALGAGAYAGGARPLETLHYLYAAVAVGALPAAHSFASEAPPRPRAWVFFIAGLLMVGMTFRLLSTG